MRRQEHSEGSFSVGVLLASFLNQLLARLVQPGDRSRNTNLCAATHRDNTFIITIVEARVESRVRATLASQLVVLYVLYEAIISLRSCAQICVLLIDRPAAPFAPIIDSKMMPRAP